jgi:hypothetical protein
MKKLTLALLFAACVLSVSAQDSTKKVFRNEFGIDVTGLLKEFLNFNNNSFGSTDYQPVYYLSYRYHLHHANLRAGLGGMFSVKEFPSYYNDTDIYDRSSMNLSLRLGYEWTSRLSRRWQAYYGVDFRTSFTHEKNDSQFSSGGYSNGNESSSQQYGLAPLLGFRFRLNPRLSICTEASFAFYYQVETSRRYYESLDPNTYPPKADEVKPKTQSFFSSFEQPLSLFLTFDL